MVIAMGIAEKGKLLGLSFIFITSFHFGFLLCYLVNKKASERPTENFAVTETLQKKENIARQRTQKLYRAGGLSFSKGIPLMKSGSFPPFQVEEGKGGELLRVFYRMLFFSFLIVCLDCKSLINL